MDECVKAGDVCPSALHCLKQGDGSYACGCDAKGFRVVGERDARNCEGSYFMDFRVSASSSKKSYCLAVLAFKQLGGR